MKYDVLHGDVIEKLQEIPDNTFDALLSDPPYSLNFMGLDWDKAIPGTDVWGEVLRTMKPGAFGLVFGGTRTFHRLAVALEDAGFELRDTLMWVYSQGFPKSHNFGCRCSYEGSIQGTQQATEHDMRGVRHPDVSSPLHAERREGSVLQPGVPQSSAPQYWPEGAESRPTGEAKSSLEGGRDIPTGEGELHRPKVCTMPEGVFGDGPEGRLCDGASPGNGSGARAVPVSDRSGTSPQPQPEGQPPRKPGAVPQQRSAQASRRGEATCPTCGGLADWQGYGTALKPAWEPVLLVRKPTPLTFAQNALEHGCGALNIDGTRVPVGDDEPRPSGSGGRTVNVSGDTRTGPAAGMYGPGGNGGNTTPATGRWPANVIHDGSPEVLERFPRTQSGSAARFFYAAKSSPKERSAGLDERCKHPTMKPIALAEYLAKLLLPPTDDAHLLVPFSGSGSELIGAAKAGWPMATGIEMEPQWVEVAAKRLLHHSEGDE